MQLFLCHTPLHILIGLLVAQEMSPEEEIAFAVVEDSEGLHALASTLIRAQNVKLLLLPGAVNSKSLVKCTLIRRANGKFLKCTFSKIADTVFLFHDLRAESQALLNSPSRSHIKTRFVLLEDGIALYEPRSLLIGSTLSILKRKIAFGLNWKNARELGLHPQLSEIRCFYPHLVACQSLSLSS